ncbi:tyrosyl-tRNA synthetase [Arachnomyces sp. PD_36]|nr:tyrosyl-tRNA synthetase [Arachnomyces sp. PD_36]
MAFPPLARSSTALNPSSPSLSFTVCRACRAQARTLFSSPNSLHRARLQSGRIPVATTTGYVGRRWISQGFQRRTAEADAAWAAKAKEIKEGKRQSFIQMLDERGLLNSVAGERDLLEKIINEKRVGIYSGVDPTGPSLHIGHMLPFMVLAWAYVYGIRSVWLLGGSTAQVGDPSGRLEGRKKTHSSVRKANMANMHMQLKRLGMSVERYGEKYGYQREWSWRRVLQNNNTWWNKQPMLEVMRDLGSWTRIGPMLGRDTVKNRLEKGGGMSFAEFGYPVMQAWDWWMLYKQLRVQVQVGGSDQYGNILFGTEAVKQIAKNHVTPDLRDPMTDDLSKPIGFTTPLLTSSSGEKMGKSSGNAIWLDSSLTSTFDLYQYFIRTSDQDVERYLKLFTFIPIPKIAEIMEEQKKDPSKRVAQHALARDFVELIHGRIEAEKVQESHRQAFASKTTPQPVKPAQPSDTRNPKSKVGFWNPAADPLAKPTTFETTLSPHVTLPESLVYNQFLHKVLWHAGLVSSKSEGHRVAVNRGAYVGSRPGDSGKMEDAVAYTPIKTWGPEKTKDFILDGGLLILRVGKWKVKIVKIIPDEEFEAQGLTAPGWKEEDAAEPKEPDTSKTS